MEKSPVQKNSEIEVAFIDLTYEGLGVAKVDGFPVFVENALPGEKGKIRIEKVATRYAYGTLLSLNEKSPDRLEVKAKHQVLSSTIPLQHLTYEKQLEFKNKIIKDALSKEISLDGIEIRDILGMDNPWHYRNKTQVPVRANIKKMETGVFVNRSHHLMPTEDFRINLSGMDEMVSAIREILITYNEKAYDERTHTGNIRHIIIRKGYYTNEVMVLIVTRSKSLFPQSKIVPAIVDAVPGVVSIIHNINPKRTADILGEQSAVIYGSETYQDILLNKHFEITARSFLQVNIPQAEILYTSLLDLLDLQGNEVVLDAYCGIGTISLSLAEKAKKVIGIEIVGESVDIAKRNALKNGLDNVEFIDGDVAAVTVDLQLHADVIVVDPPRKGLDTGFVEDLLILNPDKIAYISCNPATLARDVKRLIDGGYSIKVIQPVDMFPQTVHVECITLLTRK